MWKMSLRGKEGLVAPPQLSAPTKKSLTWLSHPGFSNANKAGFGIHKECKKGKVTVTALYPMTSFHLYFPGAFCASIPWVCWGGW